MLQNLPEITLLVSGESFPRGDVSGEQLYYEGTRVCWFLIAADYCVVESGAGEAACLKCIFCYLRMVRPTDQEMIVIEKIVCYTSQEEGTCHGAGGGGAQGSPSVR